nr:MAG TPA: hypothetical protein [Caudoviricetes sp.]
MEVTSTVCPVPAFTSDSEDLFTERADAPAAHLNWHLTIFPALSVTSTLGANGVGNGLRAISSLMENA